MTATVHSLTGASLGCLIPNPLISLPLAFASNFILDAIPHWDTGTGRHNRPKIQTFIMSGIDVMTGLVLVYLIFGQQINPVYLFSLIFAATLPDWLASPYIFFGSNFPLFTGFYKFQSEHHARNGTIWGVVTQLVVVIPLILAALYILKVL